MPQKPISELTESAMKNLQALIDANTVIGKEITTADGTTILPVCKVSFGYATGGSDLPSSQKEMFGGGSGGGVTITPIAFLAIKDGNIKMLQVQSFASTADRVVGMVPEVFDKVTDFVSGMKKSDPDPGPKVQEADL